MYVPVGFDHSFDGGAAATAAAATITGLLTAAPPGRWSNDDAAPSCDAYRHPVDAQHSYEGAIGDGVYRLHAVGGDYLAYCDMATAGGGWTLVMRSTDGTAYRADASAWYSGAPAVAGTAALTPADDGFSLAYVNVAGTELMFKTHQEADGYWTRFTLPAQETALGLVGTISINAAEDGYEDTLIFEESGANALGCWSQDWRVRWRNYASSDNYPDSSLFAPSALTSSYRPCGGHTAYATGVGVRTDTSNGFTGYGGSWEGVGADTAGNSALAGSSVSIWIGGP